MLLPLVETITALVEILKADSDRLITYKIEVALGVLISNLHP
jgi:hypothetical protein